MLPIRSTVMTAVLLLCNMCLRGRFVGAACLNGGTYNVVFDTCSCPPTAYGVSCENSLDFYIMCSNLSALPVIRDSSGLHAAGNPVACTSGCVDFSAISESWYRVESPYGNKLVDSYPCTQGGPSIGCGSTTPLTVRSKLLELKNENGALYSAKAYPFNTANSACYSTSAVSYTLRILDCANNYTIYYLGPTASTGTRYCIGIWTSPSTSSTSTTSIPASTTSTTAPTTSTTAPTTLSTPSTTSTTAPTTLSTTPTTSATTPTTPTTTPTTSANTPTTPTTTPTTSTTAPTTLSTPPATSTTATTTSTTAPTTLSTTLTTPNTTPTTSTHALSTATPETVTGKNALTTLSTYGSNQVTTPTFNARLASWNHLANDTNPIIQINLETISGEKYSAVSCSVRSNSAVVSSFSLTAPGIVTESRTTVNCDLTAVLRWLHDNNRLYINCLVEVLGAAADVTVCQTHFRERSVRYQENRGQCLPDGFDDSSVSVWEQWFGVGWTGGGSPGSISNGTLMGLMLLTLALALN